MFTHTPKPEQCWATEMELQFIDGLGRWSEAGITHSRRDILLGYKTALDARKEWGSINKHRVSARVAMRIGEC